MSVYDGIDKETALNIINSLVNTEGAEIGITLSKEFLKSLLSALNDDEQNGCVKWHPYPQEKPTDWKEYIVTLKHTKRTTSANYDPEDDEWRGNDDFYIPNNCIVAWLELPEPYEDKKE